MALQVLVVTSWWHVTFKKLSGSILTQSSKYTSQWPYKWIYLYRIPWGTQGYKRYFQEFMEKTTIQGAKYIVLPGQHPAERIFWIIIVCLAIGSSTSLIISSYQRFRANPTVVTLEKNFRQWFTPFPAVTMCYQDRVNKTRAQTYIKQRWGNVTESMEQYYLRFIDLVANINYDRLREFSNFSHDTSLSDIDMEDLVDKVNLIPRYRSRSFLSTMSVVLSPIMTEYGLCYSWGSTATQYLMRNFSSVMPFEPAYCHVLNTACYAIVMDLDYKVKYWIHSPYEVLDLVNKPHMVGRYQGMNTGYSALELTASTELKNLDQWQRRCVFAGESENAASYNLCKMHCRRKLALQICGCIPYFYKVLGDGRECDVEGLLCLAQHQEKLELLQEVTDRHKFCRCLPQCSEIYYLLEQKVVENWKYPVPETTQFRWAIDVFSQVRYRRDVIFTFEDLLVSFGGTAALFLGCSLLSAVEVVYFFTLRLACRLCCTRSASSRS